MAKEIEAPQLTRVNRAPRYLLHGTPSSDGQKVASGTSSTGDGHIYPITNLESAVLIQVLTFNSPSSVSLRPEGTLANDVYEAVQVTNLSNNNKTTDITGPGLYMLNTAQFDKFKTRVATISGGEVAVVIRGARV